MSEEVKKTGEVVVNMTVDEDALKRMAVKIIEENDFVKVVRCKDCIHRPIVIDPDKPDCGFNLRPPQNDEGYEDWSCHFLCDDGYYSRMPSDDDFCSWGNRKDGGNNECK